jgi:hypothetical protein
MNTYKITNLTNLLGRREARYNSVVDIEYVDNRARKVTQLKPGESVFLTVQSLPLSVHRLRIKKVIDVGEVSAAELQKSMEKIKPKAPKNPIAAKKPVAKKVAETVSEEIADEPTLKKITKKKPLSN